MNLRLLNKDTGTFQKLDSSLWKMIYLQFVDFAPSYVIALICLFLTHYIQSFLPFMAKDVAEKVGQDASSITISPFIWMAVGIILFRTSSRLLFFYPARVMERDFRACLLTIFEKVSPNRYKSLSKGQLFQVIYTDTEQIRSLVGFALLQIGNVAVALFILIPKIIQFSPSLVISLLPMLLSFILFTIIVGKTRKYYRATMDLQGEVQNFIMETYEGKNTIKNFHAEKSFLSSFDKLSYVELLNFYKSGVGVSFSLPLLPLGVGLSLIWGSYIIFDLNLGASSLILLSGFIFLFMEPLMFVAWIGVVFVASIASWKRLKEAFNLTQIETETEKRLKELNYYEDEHHYNFDFWNEQISINIPSSKWSIIVGQTGHGKTYLLNHLAEILKNRGDNVSYVAQTPYLYNDSIKNNIFLGKVPTDEEVKKALELIELFNLTDLDTNSNKLLDLQVGEQGKKVSGGQAKRICLIRSLMSGANILLWDDPFSSVDLIHEASIIKKLKSNKNLKNKTFILTGHRLSTVKNCEWIIYIDKSEGIVEEGNRDEILKANRKTYEYFRNQFV